MRMSDDGIEFLKHHEGLRLTAYPDPASGGEPWTCGYGCTHGVHKGMKITMEEAENMLREALVSFEVVVTHSIIKPLTQNQFDALVSLCYNIGIQNFSASSVLRNINAGRMEAAADSFLLWDKANHHVMPGLHHRRAEERALFLT